MRPNLADPRRRLAAVRGLRRRSAPAIAWLVVVVQKPGRALGRARLARVGFVVYVDLPAAAAARVADARRCARRRCIGPAVALEYRNILVPVVAGPSVRGGDRSRLPPRRRARRRDRRAAASSIVPLELPLDAECSRRRSAADELLDEARGDRRALRRATFSRAPASRPPRRARASSTRRRAPAERDHRHGRAAGAPRARGVFGETVDYVLKHAPCRVMVVGRPEGGCVNPYRSAVTRRSASIFIGDRARDDRGHDGRAAAAAVRLHAWASCSSRSASAASICSGTGASLTSWHASCPGSSGCSTPPALFSVAYGEIASSIYFALGVIALHALGFTPIVLLGDRAALPDRLALVRGRDGGDSRDRRRRDVRPARLQRLRRASSPAGCSSSTT